MHSTCRRWFRGELTNGLLFRLIGTLEERGKYCEREKRRNKVFVSLLCWATRPPPVFWARISMNITGIERNVRMSMPTVSPYMQEFLTDPCGDILLWYEGTQQQWFHVRG